jgi:glycine betaine/proline transport system ATP-binding protein
MIIRDALKSIVDQPRPVRVSDNGKAMGVVSSEDVLRLISGVA